MDLVLVVRISAGTGVERSRELGCDQRELSAPAGDFVVEPTNGPLLLASAGAGITTVLRIVEHIARTQPQRRVIVAHADRTAQDHVLRETVLHVGRQLNRFTDYTWYQTVDPPDIRAHSGHMDLTDIPLPEDGADEADDAEPRNLRTLALVEQLFLSSNGCLSSSSRTGRQRRSRTQRRLLASDR